MDYVIEWKAGPNLQLSAAPNLNVQRQPEGIGGTGDQLDPDAVTAWQWANVVRAALDSITAGAGPGEARLIGPVLPDDQGSAFVGVGWDPKASSATPFYFVFDDSANHRGWRVLGSRQEVDNLLETLAVVGRRILFSDSLSQFPSSADLYECHRPRVPADSIQSPVGSGDEVDEHPDLLAAPGLYAPDRWRGPNGRVWLSVVVDTAGRAEPATACIVLSDGASLTDVVLRALPRFRFRPGRVNGRGVRVLVLVPINFVRR